MPAITVDIPEDLAANVYTPEAIRQALFEKKPGTDHGFGAERRPMRDTQSGVTRSTPPFYPLASSPDGARAK